MAKIKMTVSEACQWKEKLVALGKDSTFRAAWKVLYALQKNTPILESKVKEIGKTEEKILAPMIKAGIEYLTAQSNPKGTEKIIYGGKHFKLTKEQLTEVQEEINKFQETTFKANIEERETFLQSTIEIEIHTVSSKELLTPSNPTGEYSAVHSSALFPMIED